MKNSKTRKLLKNALFDVTMLVLYKNWCMDGGGTEWEGIKSVKEMLRKPKQHSHYSKKKENKITQKLRRAAWKCNVPKEFVALTIFYSL